MTNQLAVEAIRRGRVRLLSSHPFYGHLACRFKLREWAEDTINGVPMTMATDGEHLFYSPEFVLSLSKTQIVAALAHETTHVYLKHPLRMLDVMNDPEKDWPYAAYAADLAINPRLKDAGFDIPPNGAYPDKQYWDDAFEVHYKRLKKEAKQQKQPKCGKCGGGCAGVQPPKGKGKGNLSAAERAKMEADIQEAVMSAANFARAAGKLPADIERMIADLRAPKISWKDVLRRFMTATTKNDYRMMPPNRRYIHQGIYLPSLRSDAVEDVLLIIDGSGSTYNVFPQFISEFASVLLDVRPERLHVMVWDTRCTWHREFDGYSDESQKSLAELQPEMGAGGGTVFTECFDWFAKETGITPQVGIVLTDMELFGEWPADPSYPVLWVASTDIVGPYGETVKIEE